MNKKPTLITNKKLMAEWDWEENDKNNLDPRVLTIGSSEKVNWVCPKGHKWTASISNRTRIGSNCPYCANKKVLAGYNDLQSQRPDLMSEWDYEANKIDPSAVAVGSQKKAHWKCEKGHKWIATISHRTTTTGRVTNCPYCANKKVLAGYNDLQSQRPDLMSEWDWEENEKINLDPKKLTIGSGKKAHWICSKGHKWTIPVDNRTGRGSNCPYCSNKKVLAGYNDLQSQRPDLMSEWDFENNTIDPSQVTTGSNKKAAWVCPKGHKYTKIINLRVSGSGCPTCAKALATSFPEQCYFFYIKKIYPESINGYTDIFDNGMELDIYIPSIKTGIEYDGVFWHDQDALPREEKKYQICKENGIRLFRIKEGDFKGFADNADRTWFIPKKRDYHLLDFYITDFLKHLTFWSVKLPDVNVERDKMQIQEYKTLKLEDSLAYLYPELAKEWHPTKNGKLTPDLFLPGSSDSVWWLCPKCGNEWKSIIANRTKGHGCDKCAAERREVTKKETLLSRRGSIDKEWCLLDWDYEANEFGPEHYTNGSGEVVNWKCHKCGHKWKAAIVDRTREYRNGCPLCSVRASTVVSGVNDLATLFPELMQEWDYEHNTEIDPTKVAHGSHLYASWKCKKCGYVWQAKINNRTNGKGCPCCTGRVVVPGVNDLATTDPELTKEWHPKLNDLKPTEVTRGQRKKIYWLCSKCGHVWQDTLNHRSRGRGCPVCSGKVVIKGINDLPTVAPELMEEWDFEHNSEVDPTTVSRGSNKSVSWKCKNCGYIWKAQICNRVVGRGCPCCANRVVVPGVNDLATTDPELAAEWHPTLNTLKPTEVTRGQAKKIYWRCTKCGHIWQAALYDRSAGKGCSNCKKLNQKHKMS